jgi:ribosomal protein S18 acetylase RimI-like enzyme
MAPESPVQTLGFKPAGEGFARFLADVHTAEHPDEPEDPAGIELWLRNGRLLFRPYTIEVGGVPAGFALSEHNHWEAAPDRVVWLYAGLVPAHRTAEGLGGAYQFLEGHAHADGGKAAMAYVREDDDAALAALQGLGYSEDRREHFWELDLKADPDRLRQLADLARERMRREGIEITTLAADRDPDRYLKTHLMSTEAEQDIPTSDTIVPDSFEYFMEWVESPNLHQDRFWIARVGAEVVGLSTLSYPVERGIVSTDFTCVARSHRGQGVARALKLETIVQAIDLGVDRVRTDNDFQNAPILHLNEELGYRHVFDWIKLARPL